jgi:predicted branched-subunit amino acid permease
MINSGRAAVLVAIFLVLFLGFWRQAANLARLLGGEEFSLAFRSTSVAVSTAIVLAALSTLLTAYFLRERR